MVAHSTPSADSARRCGGLTGLIDGKRVGIYGWSYGGYLAAMALMRVPDVFHFAVAGAAQPSAARRRRAGSWRRCGRSARAVGARGMAFHALTTLYTAQGGRGLGDIVVGTTERTEGAHSQSQLSAH